MLDRARNYEENQGAHTLARAIEEYWAARGKRPRIFVVPDTTRSNGAYVVRSNMIGGWP